jgi:sulfur-carrier protein adenylyltransferase/sulfurtransferase
MGIDVRIDDPVVTVHIPAFLRRFSEGAEEAIVSGFTVSEALSALEREHPGILSQVLAPDGSIRPSVELFLGGNDIRCLQGLATPIASEELLAIVPVEARRPGERPVCH